MHIHTSQLYVVTAEFVYPDGKECAAAFSSLSRLVTIIRSYGSPRSFFPPFFLFTHDDPSSRDRKRIDRLVGYLLKIGSLLFPHRRSSHEHPRSIKSPPANGTRVDMDQEGREEFLFFFKKRYRFKNTIDRFLLSFFSSSLRIPFILLKVRVTFAPRCGEGDEQSAVRKIGKR